MKPNAINDAIGALKLVPMFLNHHTVVSRATLIGATTEALARLEELPAASVELMEAFRCVNAVIRETDTAYVTATNSPEKPIGAVVADQRGRLLATATGKTKEGLAELIRLQLVPHQEGYGEDA